MGNTVRELDAKLDSPDTDSDILRFLSQSLNKEKIWLKDFLHNSRVNSHFE